MNPRSPLQKLWNAIRNRGESKAVRRPAQTAAFAIESLESRIALANDFFVVPGTSGSVDVEFHWTFRQAAYNNEFGVYAVDNADGQVSGIDPGEAGYAAAVAQRAQVIFRSGSGAGARSELTLTAGQRLGIYFVQDGTTRNWAANNPNNVAGQGPIAFFSFDAANPDNIDHFRSGALGEGAKQFNVEDLLGGGDRDFNDAILRMGEKGRTNLFRSTGAFNELTRGQFTLVGRNGALPGEIGIYTTDNAAGAIGSLLPGSSGYAAAALARRLTIFTLGEPRGSRSTLDIPRQTNFGYYLVVGSSARDFLSKNPTNTIGDGPLAFFSQSTANPDRLDHIRLDADNLIAFEDLPQGGDADFNDFIVRASFRNMVDPNFSIPNTAALADASDSGVKGDRITDVALVTLTGTANPNTTVDVVGQTATTTADALGNYTLAGVALASGINNLLVRFTDPAFNATQISLSIDKQNRAPIVNAALLPDINQTVNTTADARRIAVDLALPFLDGDISNTIVRFNTNEGEVDLELFDSLAPRTVANFLNYIEENDYANSIFHRRFNAPQVLQGGGFEFAGSAPTATLPALATDPTVPNEFSNSRPNTIYSVAMAKQSGDPNSATSQFFVNLADNTTTLGSSNNGGFTVFGQVTSDTRANVDSLAAIPPQNRSSVNGAFGNLPLQNFDVSTDLGMVTPSNLAFITSTEILRRTEELTFTFEVTSTTNANLLTTSGNNRLFLDIQPNQTGTATIRVTATDRAGASVQDSFVITVA